ncbi:MAG: BspA family leucine-rich repeat surface protein, partial [Flavobacteriales bacterium]|nr:BspA family leucine-rich repeat surface protein [Flavobacteriales bacterium]
NFITRWNTGSFGNVMMAGTGTGYNYHIYWFVESNPSICGFVCNVTNPNYVINVGQQNVIVQVQITGNFPRHYFYTYPAARRPLLLTVKQWGSLAWQNLTDAFAFAANLDVVATDVPNLTNCSSLLGMFCQCPSLIGNSSFNSWNTSNVTNMSFMFNDATSFNQAIGNWQLHPNVNLTNMLDNCGMSCANYSATLQGWAGNPSCPSGRNLGAVGRQYNTAGATARAFLTGTKGWTITGDAAGVNPTLTLTSGPSTTNQSVGVGTPITNIIYSRAGITSVSFSGLPPGVYGYTSGSTVTISGTPTSTGTYNYTVTGTGSCGSTSFTGTITVHPLPTISLTSAPGTNNQAVTEDTPITPITYATTNVTSVSITGLPTGVTFTFSGGTITISGTPPDPGVYNYTITATGPGGTVTATGTITVHIDPTITLTSAPGTDNQAVTENTPITNITYATTGVTSVNITGLPPGVNYTFSGGVITISGTPTTPGTYTYTITGTGPGGTETVTGTITVHVDPTITLTSAPGTDNQAVTENTPITNITYATSGVTSVNITGLPPGVNYTFSGGVITISGTPTVPGTYNYTITGTGPGGTETVTGTITVHVAPTFTPDPGSGPSTQSLCYGGPGITPIVYNLTGITSVSFSGLPPGITGNHSGSTVTISGTPTVYSGTYNYTVTGTGPGGTATATGTITITGLCVTQLIPAYCNSTVNAMMQILVIDSVPGKNYEVRLTDGVNTHYLIRPNRGFYLAMLPGMLYGTTYAVDVRWTPDDVTWSPYGPVCMVTTPSTQPLLRPDAGTCGLVMSSYPHLIKSETYPINYYWLSTSAGTHAEIYGATQYQFDFRSSTPAVHQVTATTTPPTGRNYHLNVGGGLRWGYTYRLRIRSYVPALGWSGWGDSCNITTPPMPLTQLQPGDCGATITSNTQVFRAIAMHQASQYEFKLSDANNNIWTVVRPNRGCYLKLFGPSNWAAGTYSVQVRWKTSYGEWSPWGPPCNLVVPNPLDMEAEGITEDWFDVQAFPVPFEESFSLTVQTTQSAPIHVSVMDMNGRLVEDRVVQMEHNGLLMLGEGWADGVYAIRVQQGTEVRTLRVVKAGQQ